ncbi:glycosyltransferase [Alteromonas sp. A081]|uniref:glycosyltransferase n=1 Tax=Alteromonas sp. A081 TaxID=3410269 RepID=UPI003B9877E7
MSIKLPWRITNLYENIINSLFWCRSIIFSVFFRKAKHRIFFNCGFHGKTGGAIAITSIANMLSEHFEVFFLSRPTSPLNRYLNPKIRLTQTVSYTMDLYICDLSSDIELLLKLKSRRNTVIVSCHGMPKASQKLPIERVYRCLNIADMVHFVSSAQQAEFNLPAHRHKVIANTCHKIIKTTNTKNAGVVGNLDLPEKGAKNSVNIALASNADYIHLWGVEKTKWPQSKVCTHPWEHDKKKIYNSFDVLVFMSESETFGLVVIEAISAGIPCLLSPIPAFRQFENVPGIIIVDNPEDIVTNSKYLNYLLENKSNFSTGLTSFYMDTYSIRATQLKWKNFATKLIQRNSC